MLDLTETPAGQGPDTADDIWQRIEPSALRTAAWRLTYPDWTHETGLGDDVDQLAMIMACLVNWGVAEAKEIFEQSQAYGQTYNGMAFRYKAWWHMPVIRVFAVLRGAYVWAYRAFRPCR